VPVAAAVNGRQIYLADFQAELARYLLAVQASGLAVTEEEAVEFVLQDMIDEMLLEEAALVADYQVDVAARKAGLIEQLGSEALFNEWLVTYGYDPASFDQILSRAAAAAWQRDRIAAQVPTSDVQVHARQIFTREEADANAILRQLKAGADFATVAEEYDPIAKGELGWFAKGYLLQPSVEAAAFALQPGEFSEVIPSEIGFHIIQVIEIDPARLIPSELLLERQIQAVESWILDRRANSQIETFIP
jgi:parvulin-like peptidyl-prolyl isomerase